MVEAVAILTNERYMKLINPFCGQSLFKYKGVPRTKAKTGFKDPEECPFPLNRGVPSIIQVTNTKLM